jgi:hypothetical protein
MTGIVIPFPEYPKGTHWRNPAICVECGNPTVCDLPSCRYCGQLHLDRCCKWEHDQNGGDD